MPSLVGLAQYAKVKKLTETGEGASLQTLTRVAHIHLFGISIIFPLGLIFSFAVGIPKWLKISASACPFAFLNGDIFS